MNNKSFFKNLLNFDKMITPTIIKILYYIFTILTILVGLAMIITGIGSYYGGGFQVLMGIITIILAPLMIRVYCEILIVVFKINERLENILETVRHTEKDKM